MTRISFDRPDRRPRPAGEPAAIDYNRPERQRPTTTPVRQPQPPRGEAPAPVASVALRSSQPAGTLTRGRAGADIATPRPDVASLHGILALAAQRGALIAAICGVLMVLFGVVGMTGPATLFFFGAVLAAVLRGVARRTSVNAATVDPDTDSGSSPVLAHAWEALDERRHAVAFPGDQHERWAVAVFEAEGRTAVALLRFRDVSTAHEERVQVWEQDRRTFPAGSDQAAMIEAVERFAAAARDHEGQAYTRSLALIAHQQQERAFQAQTQSSLEQLRAAARGESEPGHMTPAQALAGRQHAADFPGIEHHAYCVQITEVDGAPTLRMLGFNPAFPGRAERTESFVVQEHVFDASVDVATLTGMAFDWAVQARRKEWDAYQPFAVKAEHAEREQIKDQARAEIEADMREEARRTIDAARQALGS